MQSVATDAVRLLGPVVANTLKRRSKVSPPSNDVYVTATSQLGFLDDKFYVHDKRHQFGI